MIDFAVRVARWLGYAPGGRVAALAAIAVLLLGQQLMTVGGDTAFSHGLNNALHIPWFAVLSVLLMCALRFPPWPVLFAVCVAVAAGTEIAQLFDGRDASVWDVGRDLLGALPVIGVMELTRRRGLAVAGIAWVAVLLLIGGLTVEGPARAFLACRLQDQPNAGVAASARSEAGCAHRAAGRLHRAG